jgi:hypothetical protein
MAYRTNTTDTVKHDFFTKEGETVVVSAQFLLDSEASLKASLERMEPVAGASSSAPFKD